MFFVSTFLRSSDPAHALRQFSLTAFLLPSILCLFASSFRIDDSCENYKGNDIGEDIEQAMVEVGERARDAFVATNTEASKSDSLLATLFGPDRSRHAIVIEYFLKLSALGPSEDLIIICDDQRVKLEEDKYQEPPNPLGIWVDHRYNWGIGFNSFKPCNPEAHNLAPHDKELFAYTVGEMVYVCPSALDLPIGRSIAPFKDTDNLGKFIEDFMSLPVILFHELLHSSHFELIDAEVRSYPPVEACFDSSIDVYDSLYINSLPMTNAYGFSLCQKLAFENPDLAVRNADSVALCALGLYLHKNDWAKPVLEGFASELTY